MTRGVEPLLSLVPSLVDRRRVRWRTTYAVIDAAPAVAAAAAAAAAPVPVPVPIGPVAVAAGPRTACTVARAPRGTPVQLYRVAHARAGDKHDRANISLILYAADDLTALRDIVTPAWVRAAFAGIVDERAPVAVFVLPGIAALNIVIDGALDGGVTRSRRIDRHGKSLSDVLLSQVVVLP